MLNLRKRRHVQQTHAAECKGIFTVHIKGRTYRKAATVGLWFYEAWVRGEEPKVCASLPFQGETGLL